MATAPNSASLGYLAPTASFSYDTALEDTLQAAVVGLTGLAGKWVRPRWQLEPPQQPAFDQDWVAFGIVRSVVDTFSYDRHDSDTSRSVERDELLFVLHSFYGPNAHGYCERFRDGLEMPQNRDELRIAKIAVVDVGEATILPALLKEKWVKRVDAMVTYRRRTARPYNLLTFLDVDVAASQ
jgi:hypothetical protein